MDGAREEPAEGLSVLSEAAVLRICILHRLEQLLSEREVQEEGGRRERERETKSHTWNLHYITLHG